MQEKGRYLHLEGWGSTGTKGVVDPFDFQGCSSEYLCQESPLPHSPRTISFLNHETACFGYSPTEYAIFSLVTLTANDVSIPVSPTSSVPGMGTLSGLTGYMTLGLGAKSKPCVTCIKDSEALIIKDGGFLHHSFLHEQNVRPSCCR